MYAAEVRLVLVLLLLPIVGCVTVAPYEREILARSDMQFEGNAAVATAEGHATATREGTTGGFGGGGGGCGCN